MGGSVLRRIVSFLLLGPRYVWLRAHEWAWFSALFAVAIGAMSVNEFGLAIFLLSLAAISLLSQSSRRSFAGCNTSWTIVARVILSVLVVIVLICVIGIVNVVRDGHPWSQLPKAIATMHKLFQPENPVQSKQTPQEQKQVGTIVPKPASRKSHRLEGRPNTPCTLKGGTFYANARDMPGGSKLDRPAFE